MNLAVYAVIAAIAIAFAFGARHIYRSVTGKGCCGGSSDGSCCGGEKGACCCKSMAGIKK